MWREYFLLNAFMKEWCEEKGRGLIGHDVRMFSMVQQERRRLMMALYSSRNLEMACVQAAPKWNKEILLEIMT